MSWINPYFTHKNASILILRENEGNSFSNIADGSEKTLNKYCMHCESMKFE